VTTDLVLRLLGDLGAEKADVVRLLTDRPATVWALETPAVGWTVHDQVAHLAHLDAVTALAISDPAAFAALRDARSDPQAYLDGIGPANHWRDGAEMLRWWDESQQALRAAATDADPGTRVPWFGPSMSLPSKLSARIMETWAHGQDVADALGVHRVPTARLQHVARLGVLALPHSFAGRGLPVPSAPVRVELTAPDGLSTWSWGPEDAADVVRGDALDFCLVVTRRRHLADTGLEVSGEVATAWMPIAQAFAGPPGEGRRPGQFAAS
jgi:uncharacterized protein (TIGR03084 family)